MFCDNCGAKLPEGSRYCGVCGKDLSDRVGTSHLPKEDDVIYMDRFVGADRYVYEQEQGQKQEYQAEEHDSGNYGVVAVLAIILLICAFALPMYSFFEGLFPEDYVWTVEDTFEAFEEDGMDALSYRAVSLHFWTWVAGAGLLISALCRSKAFSIIASIVGIILPIPTIADAVDFLGEDFLSLSHGCLGIGYYVPLILFVISLIIMIRQAWLETS
ncbi:MAG: zinc ribbon domain-containing protein [Oscillospiraceae bacterium]|nr:zinc ribbon domain-containing protein [Oscillospiraceae bacterium]